MFCPVPMHKAVAILQKWGGALKWLLEKGIPRTSFWKEYLKKAEPVIIDGKKLKVIFIAYIAGRCPKCRQAKLFSKGPNCKYFWLRRPETLLQLLDSAL